MKEFSNLKFEVHPNPLFGFKTLARGFYPNGYGASVITGGYGDSEKPYEVAVLKGNESGWDLCYNTPITDDVVGYLSAADVDALLVQIKELPKC